MNRLRVAVIGLGFIGANHVESIRRLGFADIVAAADAQASYGAAKAKEMSIDRFYSDSTELLAREDVDIVHNCTPNHMHWSINKQIIEAGKHVLSEKPLGTDSGETGAMLDLLAAHPEVANAVNLNYRMSPLVQDMRQKVIAGEIGRPLLVHGSFLQDWLLYDTDYNWRVERSYGGPSRAIADIGSHWMDAVQTILGDEIVEVCSDLATVFPVRKKPLQAVETFSIGASGEYELCPIDTEDYGAVLFRTRKGTRGVFHVSQVSAGRKCKFTIEIDGTQSALYWDQESADRMWVGYRDTHNLEVMRNPGLMSPAARQYTYLAAGHPEGWSDALKSNIWSFYQFIRDGRKPGDGPTDFATFKDGHRLVQLTEAVLRSAADRRWITVE